MIGGYLSRPDNTSIIQPPLAWRAFECTWCQCLAPISQRRQTLFGSGPRSRANVAMAEIEACLTWKPAYTPSTSEPSNECAEICKIELDQAISTQTPGASRQPW